MPAKDTYAVFYLHPQIDGQHFDDTRRAKGEGEKIYKDRVMAEIIMMGSKNTSISKRVFEDDDETPIIYEGETLIERYPRAWAQFNRESGVELDGEPLRVLGGVGPGQLMNLAAKGIDTVEQLADLPDSVVLGESGMADLRKKAQAYLAVLNPERELAEKTALHDEVATLKRQLEQMQEAIQEQAPKRRGRKPKTEAA